MSSIKIKMQIEDYPKLWLMRCPDSLAIVQAGYVLEEQRLFVQYREGEKWFLYENVPSRWWVGFTKAEQKADFILRTKQKYLGKGSRVVITC